MKLCDLYNLTTFSCLFFLRKKKKKAKLLTYLHLFLQLLCINTSKSVNILFRFHFYQFHILITAWAERASSYLTSQKLSHFYYLSITVISVIHIVTLFLKHIMEKAICQCPLLTKRVTKTTFRYFFHLFKIHFFPSVYLL